MTEIYIIRHGQTDSNVRNTYLGHTDIELNEVGVRQANHLADKLKHIKFDALYTSPLIRAVQTAQRLADKQKGLFMTMNYGIQERDFGLWDDLTYDEIIIGYPKESQMWTDDWINYKVPEGESALEVHTRVGETVDKIISHYPNGKIAIVTHLGVIRHMLAHLLDLKIEDSWHFTAENCSVATVQITDNYAVLASLNCKY